MAMGKGIAVQFKKRFGGLSELKGQRVVSERASEFLSDDAHTRYM
jgi:hypothetical protein